MESVIVEFLKGCRKSKIHLFEMEKIFSGDVEYEEFAMKIKDLESKGVLAPIRSHGTNKRQTELFNTYKIMKRRLREELDERIKAYSLTVHPEISLEKYLELEEAEWERDRPWIEKADRYLKNHGLPEQEIFVPELSLRIAADEKWIDEKGGKRLLSRLGLWDSLNPCKYPDPLMLCVNPPRLGKGVQLHMVVENKTTYHIMSEFLAGSEFSSLIYGAGWKILSNINMAGFQTGAEGGKGEFYYFGDLDFEGISIWHGLFEVHGVRPAVPFYRALIGKNRYTGKKNQIQNGRAVGEFLSNFDENERKVISDSLNSGCYYPQEALSKEELREIWRGFNGNII